MVIFASLHADVTQVYGRCTSAELNDLAIRVSACTDDILSWMPFNKPQLNVLKAEHVRRSTFRYFHQLPAISIRVGSEIILPSSSVRDLGGHFDADLSTRFHVQRTVAGCFAALRQTRSFRWSLPPTALQMLVVLLALT